MVTLKELILSVFTVSFEQNNGKSQSHRGLQLVARRAHNPKVVSSSLAPATKKTKEEQSEMVALFGFNALGNSAFALSV